jgi:polyisoprenoid-binding protein YceI
MSVIRHLVPHTLRGPLVAGAAAALLILGGAAALIYFVAFGASSPPPLTLSPASTAAAGAGSAPVSAAQVAGTWSVAGGSVAGYRVREQLAFLTAPSDAVGRTSSITGSATVSGSAGALTVSTASFNVDVSSLSSDRSMRDNRIHSIGLESDRFPTATFVLTAPLTLPASATSGTAVHVSATGKLTIHGVTKTETIPLDARISGSQIEVVGSITFGWGDFGMQAPSIGGFVSVTDSATMEFDLKLAHA